MMPGKENETNNAFVIQHDNHEDVAEVTEWVLRTMQNLDGPKWKAVPLIECLGGLQGRAEYGMVAWKNGSVENPLWAWSGRHGLPVLSSSSKITATASGGLAVIAAMGFWLWL